MKLQHLFLAILMFVSYDITVVNAEGEQCGGGAPMENITNFLGMALEYDLADYICCNNHINAEDKGYLEWPEINLFSRLDPKEEIVFYDSVCALPLFVAPRGRSFESFKQESIHHGWPSFRPAEIVSENVIIHPDGRMESKCGTHLGHNLPTNGVDRYCIDLVCIAGTPAAGKEFDASSYTSSALNFSGSYNKTGEIFMIVLYVVLGVVLALLIFYVTRSKCRGKKNEQEKMKSTSEEETASFSEGKQEDRDEFNM
eukprot:CAMPEP_0178928582 /NCGR_PEP_ID=MMETSP0786-20121207/19997_1 /TAXON_ID=186022 /ORGANISM="Thalassionema frauenfeldii, Strain CCMP 1798" /LENGTH=255 /DNA_ID=CAMNT_0020604489 /DNA_START=80 /DNA_END=847 /DNA_ORIENTATION=+